MAKSKTAKRYTPEFREQLVKLHRAGRSIPELVSVFLDDETGVTGRPCLNNVLRQPAMRLNWRLR